MTSAQQIVPVTRWSCACEVFFRNVDVSFVAIQVNSISFQSACAKCLNLLMKGRRCLASPHNQSARCFTLRVFAILYRLGDASGRNEQLHLSDAVEISSFRHSFLLTWEIGKSARLTSSASHLITRHGDTLFCNLGPFKKACNEFSGSAPSPFSC